MSEIYQPAYYARVWVASSINAQFSMKLVKFSLFLSTLLCTLFGALVCSAAEPYKIGDFTLLDHQGKSHQLSYYGDLDAVVILIHGNDNPLVQKSVQTLNKVRAGLAGRDIAYFMLNPQVSDTRLTIAREAEQLGYELPILVDETQLVAESLKVERLAETVVIDAQTMEVLFRGAVDELGAVLANTSKDKPAFRASLLSSSEGSTEGSRISYQARDHHQQNKVSFTNDIVPILEGNCVSCHHDGAIAPWSMSSHGMILGWSAMIREVVMTKRMPPGQIDPQKLQGYTSLSFSPYTGFFHHAS